MKIRRFRPWWDLAGAAAIGLSQLLIAEPVFALPDYRGGGTAHVEGVQSGANTGVRVTGERGMVRWHSFSVAPGEMFRVEGNHHQAILNLVNGPDASRIGGLVESGPRFLLSNPNGIEILGTGRIVAPSVWLTTGRIDVDAWLNRTGVYQGKPNDYININLDRSSAINLNGTVLVRDGERGGTVGIFAESINLGSTALVDSSGPAGGGEILIGGSWQNQRSELPQALTTTIARGARLDVSATEFGDGGTIVAWTDITNPQSRTSVSGTLLAGGGPTGGNGGRLETSGYDLRVDGIHVSTEAPQGYTGEWLLDPYNITISDRAQARVDDNYTATANNAVVNVSTLETALTSTNVRVFTGMSGNQAGNITVVDAINASGSGNLTLEAASDIQVNAPVTTTGGSITLLAAQSADGVLTVRSPISTAGGNIMLSSGRNAAGAETGSTGRVRLVNGGNLDAGNGNVSILNTSVGAATSSHWYETSGVFINMGTALNTGATSAYSITGNNVSIVGFGANQTGEASGIDIYSLNLNARGSVTVSGTAGAGTTDVASGGIRFLDTSGNTPTLIKSNGGDVTITGDGTGGGRGGVSVGYYDLSNVVSIFSQSGTTRINAKASGINADALEVGSPFNSGSTLNLGWDGSSTLGTGNVVVLGNASGTGSLHFGDGDASKTQIKTNGGEVTIGDNDSPLGALTLGNGIIDAAGKYSSFTIGGNNTSKVTVNTALTARDAGGIAITASGAISGSGNLAMSSPAASLNLVTGSSSGTLSGVISGGGFLIKGGDGTLLLTANNTYTGPTKINAGTLKVSGSLADSTAVSLNANGIYEVASSDTVGSIEGMGSIVLGSGFVLTAGGLNTDNTYSGVMSGAGGFTKVGTRITTLSGANGYAGSTRVLDGYLRVLGTGPTTATCAGGASNVCAQTQPGVLAAANAASATRANTGNEFGGGSLNAPPRPSTFGGIDNPSASASPSYSSISFGSSRATSAAAASGDVSMSNKQVGKNGGSSSKSSVSSSSQVSGEDQAAGGGGANTGGAANTAAGVGQGAGGPGDGQGPGQGAGQGLGPRSGSGQGGGDQGSGTPQQGSSTGGGGGANTGGAANTAAGVGQGAGGPGDGQGPGQGAGQGLGPGGRGPQTSPQPANPPGVSPPGANPPGANPPGVNPPGAKPPGANTPGVNPPGAKPPGANPPDVTPSGADSPATNPPAADPPGTNPPGVSPPGANPPGANPPGVNPPGAKPTGANTPDVTPSGADSPANNPPAADPPGTNPPRKNPPGAGQSGTVPTAPAVIREGVLEIGAAMNPMGGFSYQVPAPLLVQANPDVDLLAPTSASLPGGGDLPSWLTYQPTTRTFTASEPPANALPFQAQINVRTTTGQFLSLPVLIAQP